MAPLAPPLLPPVSSALPFPSALSPASASSLPSASSVAPGLGHLHGVVAGPAVPIAARPLFRPFASVVSSGAPLAPSAPAPAPSVSAPLPSVASALSRYPLCVSHAAAPFAFGASPDDIPDEDSPDAVPGVPDAALPAVVLDSFRSEFRRMLSFIIDLFPQAVGSPSVASSLRVLFEEFFAPASVPPQPLFLNWFERVRAALVDADARMASFLAAGRSDFAFLPPRAPGYAVHGVFAHGKAPVNPSLLSLFERNLKPSLQLGMSICEAAAMEASFRSQSEALSHSMWVLSGLLAFVCLQNFTPDDAVLFNTLVTSLSKSLAHQASLSALHTAFIALKRCQFYLSHLPAYFSDVNKRAMLSSPTVCANFLFNEADVSCLLADTQTSSLLRSQQALVDVVSHGSGSRSRRFSPRRSPARHSPSRCCRRDSGSPARPGKRVRFDAPAPSFALKGSRQGFRK